MAEPPAQPPCRPLQTGPPALDRHATPEPQVPSCASPPHPHVPDQRQLAAGIRTNAAAYFLFLEDDRVEPTNNRAERALRHAVIDRRIPQGTRGPVGSRWLKRFLSIRETCRQQDRALVNYLVQAITHHTAGTPLPAVVA